VLVVQVKEVIAASYYWLDNGNGKLYKKNAGNDSLQLVVAEEDWIRLLRSCCDEMEHRGSYTTNKLLQQRFW